MRVTASRLRLAAPIAAAVLLVGCGSTPAGSDPAAETQTQTGTFAPLSAEAQAFFDSIEQVQGSLVGTSAERAERDRELSVQGQEDYASCMSSEGWTYVAPDIPLNVEEAFYMPAWWAPLDRELASNGFGYAAPPVPVGSVDTTLYDALSAEDKAGYDAALSVCAARVDGSQSLGLNPEADALAGSLAAAFAKVADSDAFEATRQAYAECMNAAEIEASQPSDLSDLAEQTLIEAGIYTVDPYSQEATDARPGLRQIESAFSIADLDCRIALADEVADAFSPVLTKWLSKHQDAVDEAGALWTS